VSGFSMHTQHKLIGMNSTEQEEPRFGHPRKSDPYADLKTLGKYPGQRFGSTGTVRASRPVPRLLATEEEAAEEDISKLYTAADALEPGAEVHASHAEELANEVALGVAPEESEQDRVVRLQDEDPAKSVL
jgi:hypothetical protein